MKIQYAVKINLLSEIFDKNEGCEAAFISDNNYNENIDLFQSSKNLTYLLSTKQNRTTSLSIPYPMYTGLNILYCYLKYIGYKINMSDLVADTISSFLLGEKNSFLTKGTHIPLVDVLTELSQLAKSFDSNFPEFPGDTYDSIVESLGEIAVKCYSIASKCDYFRFNKDCSNEVTDDKPVYDSLHNYVSAFNFDCILNARESGDSHLTNMLIKSLAEDNPSAPQHNFYIIHRCMEYFEVFQRKLNEFLSVFDNSGLRSLLEKYITVMYPIRSKSDCISYVGGYFSLLFRDSLSPDTSGLSGNGCSALHNTTELTAVEQEYLLNIMSEAGGLRDCLSLDTESSKKFIPKYIFDFKSFTFTDFIRMRNLLSTAGYDSFRFFRDLMSVFQPHLNNCHVVGVSEYLQEFFNIIPAPKLKNIIETTDFLHEMMLNDL